MDPIDSDKEFKVLIPMRLSAYINYANGMSNEFTNRPVDRAYLSPIPDISGHELDVDKPAIQHDIFEHLEPSLPGLQADPNRLLPSREGIYLHWSIPDHYRTAITASASTLSIDEKKRLAGYPITSGAAATAVVFRPLPDR